MAIGLWKDDLQVKNLFRNTGLLASRTNLLGGIGTSSWNYHAAMLIVCLAVYRLTEALCGSQQGVTQVVLMAIDEVIKQTGDKPVLFSP